MIFVAVLGFLILLLLASWFVFAMLGAVEKIVRGVHDGTPEEKSMSTVRGYRRQPHCRSCSAY